MEGKKRRYDLVREAASKDMGGILEEAEEK